MDSRLSKLAGIVAGLSWQGFTRAYAETNGKTARAELSTAWAEYKVVHNGSVAKSVAKPPARQKTAIPKRLSIKRKGKVSLIPSPKREKTPPPAASLVKPSRARVASTTTEDGFRYSGPYPAGGEVPRARYVGPPEADPKTVEGLYSFSLPIYVAEEDEGKPRRLVTQHADYPFIIEPPIILAFGDAIAAALTGDIAYVAYNDGVVTLYVEARPDDGEGVPDVLERIKNLVVEEVSVLSPNGSLRFFLGEEKKRSVSRRLFPVSSVSTSSSSMTPRGRRYSRLHTSRDLVAAQRPPLIFLGSDKQPETLEGLRSVYVPIFGGVSKTVRRFRVEGPLGESNRQDIVEGLKEYAKRHPNCAKLEFVSFLAGPTASVELYGRFGLLHTATCVDELADALASEFHPLDTHLDGGRLFLGDLPTPTLPETPVVAPEAPQPLKKGKVDSNYLYVAAGRQKGQGTKPKTLKGLYEVVLRPRASHANEREALRLENFPLARLGTTILGFNHSLQPSGTSVELLRYDEAPPTLKVYVKVGEGSPATVLRKVVALLETVHIDALAGGARYRLEA